MSDNMSSPLPPYTVAVYTERGFNPGRELIAVKRIGGHWDVIGMDYWFNSDTDLFDHWPEAELVGEGIWPSKQ